jgi:hypothetical protein
MVNIDLSKVLPSRAYDHFAVFLASFLPGLFLIFSLVLAKPDLVMGLASKSEQTLAFGRYGTAAMGLFLAFVIGSGFLLINTLIQYVFTYLYQLKVFIYLQLCKWPIKQITQWLLKKPRWQSASLSNFHVRVVTRAAIGFEDWRKFQGCWFVLVRRLLKVRYGIESSELKDDEWSVLYSNLGSITPEDSRGSMMMIAIHACGWAGLVATRLAPVLRNRYYVGFCLLLILNGLMHAYYVVQGRFDPRYAGGLVIRAVLREFGKLRTGETTAREPNPKAEES